MRCLFVVEQVRADDGPRRLSSVPGSQSQGSGGGGPAAKRTPRNRFVWLGATRRRIVGLGPGEATTIPLKVRYCEGVGFVRVSWTHAVSC